ncbi:MAG: hypothetical protein QW343_04325, partial [Candidatus Norongarragalinales archaeon]
MGAYKKIEDAYYKFLDFVNDKLRIPVYDFFVKPIETRGVPSLPVAVLFVLLIAFGFWVLAFGLPFAPSEEVKLTVFVTSGGKALDGARVYVVAEGSEVASGVTRNGKVVFSNLPAKELIV